MTHDMPRGRHAALSEFEPGMTVEGAVFREAEWGEMRVGFETYLRDFDDAPLLSALPNGRCQCSHWGYLLSGRLTARYADHEETIEAGEVYYLAPDHSIAVDAGTVLIEFTPLEEWRELLAAVEDTLDDADST